MKTALTCGFHEKMEMMGIEPMSEDPSIRSATIIVGILHFPPCSPADRVTPW